MIRKLAHICIDSDNVPAMLEFYNNKLGLPTKFTLKNKEGVDFGWFIACGDTTFLEIFDRTLKSRHWGNGSPYPIVTGNRLPHFCFEVTGLAEFKVKLELSGVNVSAIATGMSKGTQCWIADPDGNSIELMEYSPASFHLRAGTT